MAEERSERSEEEVRQDAERLLEALSYLQEEAQQQGLTFVSLSEEEIIRKIRGESSSSPFIAGFGWTSAASPGTWISNNYALIFNPDPTTQSNLFVSLFFGVANFLDDIGEGLSGRDYEWPLVSAGPFFVSPHTYTTQGFMYRVPPTAPPTGLSTNHVHVANVVLWQAEVFGKGTFLDRAYNTFMVS
jgi:hypothetical protein